jgi:hypothetical protein
MTIEYHLKIYIYTVLVTLYEIQGGHILFATFQTYVNHKVLQISGNGLYLSKDPLKSFRVNRLPWR